MRRTPGLEPDGESPPVRVWRDWSLVAGVAGTAMAEVVVRDDMAETLRFRTDEPAAAVDAIKAAADRSKANTSNTERS